MQPFYLSKNQDGYFKVRFVDQTTGKLLSAKSTHTKDKFEATRIAMRWLETGIPESHGNSRQSSRRLFCLLRMFQKISSLLHKRLLMRQYLKRFCRRRLS